MPELGSAEDYRQRWERALSHNEELVERNTKMLAALLLIREWRLPYAGYSWERGSNGERDHFRRIARTAIEEGGDHQS